MQKVLWTVHYTLDSQCDRLWLCQPGRKGLKRVNGTRNGNEQGPAATTERAGAKRRCALQHGVSLPGCRKRRIRRVKGVAHPERMLQALLLRHGMEARRAETVYRLRSRQPARTPAVKPGTGRKKRTGDYMRLSGKPRQQGGEQSRDGRQLSGVMPAGNIRSENAFLFCTAQCCTRPK